MPDILNTLAEQPAPRPATGDVWADLIPILPPVLRPYGEARRQQGIERYGAPLQIRNGRDALADALQEALDLVVYLRQAELEAADLVMRGEIASAGAYAAVNASRIVNMIERRRA